MKLNIVLKFVSSVIISAVFITAFTQKTFASSNLLANPNADDGLTGWTFVNGGSGWGSWGDDPFFVTSYAWGTMHQTINLVDEGFSTSNLDSAPEIIASVDVTNTFNSSDYYSFKVQLKNSSGTVISEYYTGEVTISGGWHTISHTFTEYGTGVRYIYFELRGKDTEYWGGNYGSAFDNASLTIGAEPLPSYTLTYTAGSNGTISGSSTQTIGQGSNGTQVTATPSTGYHFTNWSDNVLTASRTDMNIQANLSVTASFAINTYTVTFKDHDNSTLRSESVNHGSSATAPEEPTRTGYSFSGWSSGYSNVTSDLTINAQYTINSYTLNYTSGDNGSVSGTLSQTVNYGSNGTEIEAIPDSNYAFVKWSDESVENPRTDLSITQNISVAAIFQIIDSDAPTKTTFKINNGNNYTNNTNVTLTVAATDTQNDVVQMMISSTPNFTGAVWETYAMTKLWNITEGDEIKNIYIKFKDSVGNESLIYSDSIILDTKVEVVLSADTSNQRTGEPEFLLINENRRETKKQRPTFSGTGESGATVTITINSNPIVGTTTVGEDGTWNWWPEVDIPYGEHEVTIVLEDAAGNTEQVEFALGIVLGSENSTIENVKLVKTGSSFVWFICMSGTFLIIINIRKFVLKQA